jgi:hypothetical protein
VKIRTRVKHGGDGCWGVRLQVASATGVAFAVPSRRRDSSRKAFAGRDR